MQSPDPCWYLALILFDVSALAPADSRTTHEPNGLPTPDIIVGDTAEALKPIVSACSST